MELTSPYTPNGIKLASQFRDVRPHNHTLPFDVLGLIFHHIPKLGPTDLQPILFVCNSWHEAVCRHCSLWSDIKLDYTIYTRFSVGDTFQESLASNYLRCCLKYSGTMPLDITMDFEQLVEMDIKSRIIALLAVLVGRGEEHLARWRSFTWRAMCVESTAIALAFLPSAIPNLQTVKIFDVFYDDDLQSAFPACPKLRTVELYPYYQLILREIDCSHVTELKLGADYTWHIEHVEVLYKFSNVRRLTLFTGRYPWSIQPSDDLTTEILFPHLHSLRLYGESVWELVKNFKTPKLKELKFDEISFLDLLKGVSLASTIESAHIQIRQRDIDSEVSYSEKVMGLFTVSPLLKHLRVPKWLHEELESGDLCLEERRVHVEVVPE